MCVRMDAASDVPMAGGDSGLGLVLMAVWFHLYPRLSIWRPGFRKS